MAGGGGRRAKGEGSIVALRGANGHVAGYAAVLDLGRGPDGKRRRVKREARTKRAAQLLLAEMRREVEQTGGVSDPRQPLDDYLTGWLAARANLGGRTREEYARLIRVHVTPAIGAIRLTKLTADDLEGLYARMRAAGLSAATILKVHAVLHTALAAAVRRRRLTANPSDHVEVERPGKSAGRPLSAGEALRLIEAAHGERLEALWILALTLGLRQGELLGLRWGDVALEPAGEAVFGTLQVRQTADLRRKGDPFGVAKTERSHRTLPLIDLAADALRRHRERQHFERQAAGRFWVEHDLVFPSRVGTPFAWNNLNKRDFARTMLKAGLAEKGEDARGRPKIAAKCRPHDLRHTCGTLLMSLRVPTAVVAAILGHSRASTTTDIYQHVDDSLTSLAAEAMGKAFGRPPAASERSGGR